MNLSFGRRRLSAPLNFGPQEHWYWVWQNKTKWRFLNSWASKIDETEERFLIKRAFLWEDLYQYLWFKITRITVHQRNRRIHSGHGFIVWCTMMRVILNHKSWSGSATKNAFYLKASSVGNLLHPNKFLSQQLWYKRAFTFQKEFIYNLFLGIHWQQCFSFAYTRHLQSAARNQKERRSPLLVGNLNLKRNEKNFVYIKSCPKWERLCHVQKRL